MKRTNCGCLGLQTVAESSGATGVPPVLFEPGLLDALFLKPDRRDKPQADAGDKLVSVDGVRCGRCLINLPGKGIHWQNASGTRFSRPAAERLRPGC
jgi:hypothetical protein